MKSQHQFSQVPSAKIPRSSFNLSHGHKTVFDADGLYPICQPIDIIPGDTFNMKTNFFIRLNTMLRPVLDNMRFETFAFFVPYRTIWDSHEKFHGAQDDPGDSIDFTIPVMSGAGTIDLGSPADHFGVPLNLVPDNTPISALPNRAYRKIFNDWFRDENLINSLAYLTGNGPDAVSTYKFDDAEDILTRGKRKDYFTSCLPWPQKGTAVSLPLGTGAPVRGIGFETSAPASPTFEATKGVRVYDGDGTTHSTDTDIWDNALESAELGMFFEVATAVNTTTSPRVWADLANATAATINDIRLAFQTQRLLERDARSGTRYVETLKAHWGVTSPDFRLQRAEFLGGGSSVINMSPVTQQSAQTTPAENDKVGNLAANGTVSGTHSWTKSFVEHGVVIILGNVRGDITYSQGLDRYWSKSTRYDFFYPVLSGIGEQSVLNKELWVTVADTGTVNDAVFGYQERYAEYRFLNSKLTSLMRPDASGTLSSWHLSEDFASLPTLGETFINANTSVPLDRAIAVPAQPQFFADFFHEIKAARPLPVSGVPGNIDHF